MEARGRGTSGPRRVLAWTIAVGYGALLAFVVFWPSPIDRPVAGMLQRVIRELHERGVPAFVNYGFIEFTANVMLFIPVGVFFGLALPVGWWFVMLLGGPVLSGLIELVQGELLSARFSSVNDVVANSIGATIGVLLMLGLRAVVAWRDERVVARGR